MQLVLLVGVLITAVKFLAFALTNSNAIFSDALESIVNLFTGVFALYSLWLASRPRDDNHPYGHGKIEFVAAGLEGVLISIAGVSLATRAILGFFQPVELQALGTGLWLTAASGAANLLLALVLMRVGRRRRSLTLKAEGHHLLSDFWSSLGLVLGLALIYYTEIYWLDNAMALLFGLLILRTGYPLLRKAFGGLMDETDAKLLAHIRTALAAPEAPACAVHLHDLRIQRFGDQLHIDGTLPLPADMALDMATAKTAAIERYLSAQLHEDVECAITFESYDPTPPDCPQPEVGLV